jgi:ABC-type sugar transport system ATPase subunit
MMALGILNVAFEVGGRSISRFEGLCGLVTDELCNLLFKVKKKKKKKKEENGLDLSTHTVDLACQDGLDTTTISRPANNHHRLRYIPTPHQTATRTILILPHRTIVTAIWNGKPWDHGRRR